MTREKAINVLEDALSRAVFMDDIDVLKMAISALREQEDPKAVLVEHYIKVPEKPKWISVEERLPEVSGRYLVMRISGDCLDCSYDADRHGSHWGLMSDLGDEGKLWITLRTVTHWMTMPELPKEDV